MLEHLLDEFAGHRGRVEEYDAARHGAAVLPRMRHVARHESTSARTATDHVIADLEGELALEHPRDLVAVMVQMKPAVLAAGRHRLLEQGHALPSLATEQL